MADVQWFQRSNTEHGTVSCEVDSELWKRLMKDLEWTPIDGPKGKPQDREALRASEEAVETPEEEAAEDDQVEAVELPIPDYDELTVEEVIPHLQDLDADQLAVVEAHEVANKNRAGVMSVVTARREELEVETEQS